MLWSILSKALLISSRTTAVNSFPSIAFKIESVVSIKDVSVEWNLLLPLFWVDSHWILCKLTNFNYWLQAQYRDWAPGLDGCRHLLWGIPFHAWTDLVNMKYLPSMPFTDNCVCMCLRRVCHNTFACVFGQRRQLCHIHIRMLFLGLVIQESIDRVHFRYKLFVIICRIHNIALRLASRNSKPQIAWWGIDMHV